MSKSHSRQQESKRSTKETGDEAVHGAGGQDSTTRESEEKVRTPDVSPEVYSITRKGRQSYQELPQELLKEVDDYQKAALDYFHDFSGGVTLATTVLLGFIFNSVLGSGASRVIPEAQQATLKLAWLTSILSILCGFLYMIAFSAMSVNYALAISRIIDKKESAKPGIAKRLWRFLGDWRVLLIVGGVAVWLQVIAFVAALLCLTHGMWTK